MLLARRALSAVLASAFLFVVAAPAAAQTPSLSGETFTATMSAPVPPGSPGESIFVFSSDCDSVGPNSFTYQANGPATGPYEGSYRENGTFTFAPGEPTTFSANFQILSPSGDVTVTGTKSSVGGSAAASCVNDAVWTVQGTAAATYQATITASEGTCTDAGTSPVDFQATLTAGQGPPATAGTFSAGPFASTSGVAGCAPATFDDCKLDAWRASGLFKNQGDCVSFVSTTGRAAPSARTG